MRPSPITCRSRVTLTAGQIQNFMAAYPAVKALADKYKDDWKEEDTSKYHGDWSQKITAAIQAHGALGEFNATIGRYGFPSSENFWQVAFSIILAERALDPDASAGHMNGQLNDAVAKVNANPNLTAAQKAQILASIQQSRGMVAEMEPPPGNKEKVAPYKDKLKTMMDFTDKDKDGN